MFEQAVATENRRQDAPMSGGAPLLRRTCDLTCVLGVEGPLWGLEGHYARAQQLEKILEAMAAASRRGGQEGR